MDTTCPGKIDAVSGTTGASVEGETSSSWMELLKISVSVLGKDFSILLEGANADINTDDENSTERSTDACLIFANIIRGRIEMNVVRWSASTSYR